MYNYFMLVGIVKEIKWLVSTGPAQIAMTLKVKDDFTHKENLFIVYFEAHEFKDILTQDLVGKLLGVKGRLIMRNLLELKGERLHFYNEGLEE